MEHQAITSPDELKYAIKNQCCTVLFSLYDCHECTIIQNALSKLNIPNLKYYQITIQENDIHKWIETLEDYKINEFPCITVFDNGSLIDGWVDLVVSEDIDVLRDALHQLLSVFQKIP